MKQFTNAHLGVREFYFFSAWGYANRKRLGTADLDHFLLLTFIKIKRNKRTLGNWRFCKSLNFEQFSRLKIRIVQNRKKLKDLVEKRLQVNCQIKKYFFVLIKSSQD